MLCPKVVGQSGTARAAPVLVTSPPNRISTNVKAAVTRARPCASLLIAATSIRASVRLACSVPRRSRHAAGRLGLREEVLLGLRRAVLVGTAIDGGHGGAPVQVRRRRGRGPLERVGVPRVHRRLGACEEAPEEVDDE